MKRISFFLFVMLIGSISLFTACSSDDDGDKPDYSTAIDSEIVGNYEGTLTVVVEGTTLSTVPQNITIEKASPTAINLSLKNFSFMGLKIGDIELKDCVLSQDGDTYTFIGTQDLVANTLSCTIDAKGTYSKGAVKVDMDVDATLAGQKQSVQVVYEGTRLVVGTVTTYDFETWVAGVEGQEPDQTFYEPSGWASSNTGAHFLKAISTDFEDPTAPMYADSYVVMKTSDAHSGSFAAKIQTIDTKGGDMGFVKVPKVTTGSLFLGSFNTDIMNTLNSTKFGIPYTQKPFSLKGWYKYTPGSDYYVVEEKPYVDHCNEAVKDAKKVDQFMISVVLYETDEYDLEDWSDCLTGVSNEESNIYTSSRIVAVGQISGGKQEAWKEFNIDLTYKKEFDSTKKYRMTIACSASKDGDKFWGAPGSTLTVDDFELTTVK